jgi:prepilin-type N-terminal cleavage/methylation domain-containing protein
MGLRRDSRGFTLIEAMAVVAIVGVLAMLAVLSYRRWVHSAYLTEAHNMVSNIRAAEESFLAENGGYLSVSKFLGPPHDYPAATPGKFTTAWGAPCGDCAVEWSTLNIQPSGPLAFGYSVVADNKNAPPGISKTVGGKTIDVSAVTAPWYYIEADGDMDGNGVFTNVYAVSQTNQLFVDHEGE